MARMSITFDKEIHDEITRLAALQGRTKSSLVNELLTPAVPVMRNMSDVIEHLRDATDEQRDLFKQSFDALTNEIEADKKSITGKVDSLLRLV